MQHGIKSVGQLLNFILGGNAGDALGQSPARMVSAALVISVMGRMARLARRYAPAMAKAR